MSSVIRSSLALLLSAAAVFSGMSGAQASGVGKPSGVAISVDTESNTATLTWRNKDQQAAHRLSIMVDGWPCVQEVVAGRIKPGVREYTFGTPQMNYCPSGTWVVKVTAVKGKAKSTRSVKLSVTEAPWLDEPRRSPGGGGGGGHQILS